MYIIPSEKQAAPENLGLPRLRLFDHRKQAGRIEKGGTMNKRKYHSEWCDLRHSGRECNCEAGDPPQRRLIIDAEGPRVEVEGSHGALPVWRGPAASAGGVPFWFKYADRITFGPTAAQPDHPGLKYVDR
jgi:hypothetical protein